jgi:hypothetical protein
VEALVGGAWVVVTLLEVAEASEGMVMEGRVAWVVGVWGAGVMAWVGAVWVGVLVAWLAAAWVVALVALVGVAVVVVSAAWLGEALVVALVAVMETVAMEMVGVALVVVAFVVARVGAGWEEPGEVHQQRARCVLAAEALEAAALVVGA